MYRYILRRNGTQIYSSNNWMSCQSWWMDDRRHQGDETEYEIEDSSGKDYFATPGHIPVRKERTGGDVMTTDEVMNEVIKEWRAVSGFLKLDTYDLVLEVPETGLVTGTYWLKGDKRYLPKFRAGDDIRQVMAQSLANL